jgi:hypothetical protein
MSFASAVARSAVLAIVSAALSGMLMLLAGVVTFAVRVRWGHADRLAGFEPNIFLRAYGLPAAAAVFLVVFSLSLWALRPSRR